MDETNNTIDPMDNNNGGLFNKLGPKQSFVLGILGALGIAFVVGFFILLNIVMSDKDMKSPSPSGTGTAPVPTAPAPSGDTGTGTVDTNFVITDEDYIRGNPDAKITIVEFSDFECPFCSRFKPSLDQALAEYPDDVRLVYKHFPLNSIHPQAQSAAEASECAGSLGGNDAFWEYHDLLFENQQRLGLPLYRELATQVDVDADELASCVENGDFRAKVQADQARGVAAGVRGTPGSFINGQSVPGAVPYTQIKAVIDSLL